MTIDDTYSLEEDCIELTICLDCKVASGFSKEDARKSLVKVLGSMPGPPATVQTNPSASLDIIWKQKQKRKQNLIAPFLESVLAVIQMLCRTNSESGLTPNSFQYIVEGTDIASADVHISSFSAAIIRSLNIDVSLRIKPEFNAHSNSLTPCKGCWFDAALKIYSDVDEPDMISAVLQWDPCSVMIKSDSDKLSNPIAVFGWYFNIESRRILPEVLVVKFLNMCRSRSEELKSLGSSCRVRLGVALFLKPSRHSSAVMLISKEIFKDMEEIGVNDGLLVNFYFM